MKNTTFEKFYFNHDKNVRYEKEYIVGTHYHNMFEVYFITEGECTYFIDNKSYNVKAGDVVLIPEGVIHNTKYVNLVHSRMLINCPKQYIPSSVLSVLTSMLYLYRNPEIFEDIKNIMEKIEKEYYNPDFMTEELLTCYTQNLFFLLAKNRKSCIRITGGNEYIENAIEFLQENLQSDISLSNIAKRYSLSPEHFSRLFKKETGLGFNKYVNLLKLQKANNILKQRPHISISEVAQICGFSDSNYFSVKFKELYNVSPKKVQKGDATK